MERSKYKACEDFDFSRCPIWIQIHNIPLEAMCVENTTMIGRYVGDVMLAEDPSLSGRLFQNFLHARVVLDLRKALSYGFWMNKPDGGRIWIAIRYEKSRRAGESTIKANDCSLSSEEGDTTINSFVELQGDQTYSVESQETLIKSKGSRGQSDVTNEGVSASPAGTSDKGATDSNNNVLKRADGVVVSSLALWCLRKVKARMRRNEKRKDRGEKENLTKEELIEDEMMDVAANPHNMDSIFVFKAKGGKYRKSLAEGEGGWPLTTTKRP
ncbi:hypothetical protein K1719_003402 [Acacia pycnantha]|nr:hypothetical protein K1719_003402 [Acacia pycnantha]